MEQDDNRNLYRATANVLCLPGEDAGKGTQESRVPYADTPRGTF